LYEKKCSEVKDYGRNIENAAYFYEAASSSKPVPKCSSVAYMKLEATDPNRRNGVASNDHFIAYTVRGSMLRVIQLHTGEKLLLKGHETDVIDFKFAPADNILCSASTEKIFIWKILGTHHAYLQHSKK